MKPAKKMVYYSKQNIFPEALFGFCCLVASSSLKTFLFDIQHVCNRNMMYIHILFKKLYHIFLCISCSHDDQLISSIDQAYRHEVT